MENSNSQVQNSPASEKGIQKLAKKKGLLSKFINFFKDLIGKGQVDFDNFRVVPVISENQTAVETTEVRKDKSSAYEDRYLKIDENLASKLGKKKGLPILYFILVIIVISLTGILIVAKRLKTPKVIPIGKKGEIVWWGLKLSEAEAKVAIDGYVVKNPGIKITYKKQSTVDYKDRLSSVLAQGTGPDIFEIHNSWTTMVGEAIDKKDIDEIESLTNNKIYYYQVIINDFFRNDQVYAIPIAYDGLTLFINEDIFAQAGKVPPQTWDEFTQLAKDLTVKSGKLIAQSGAGIGLTQNIDYWQDLLALIMLQNGTEFKTVNTKQSEVAINYYASFAGQYKVWDTNLPTTSKAFAEGKLAMFFAPSRVADEIKTLNPSLRFRTVPLPQLRKDEPGIPDIGYASYWGYAVAEKSVSKDDAWNFLDYLTEKEVVQQLHGAIEKSGKNPLPYPRIDLNEQYLNHRIIGSVVSLAPYAKSWYLAGFTYDGKEGINTKVSTIFADLVSAGQDKNSGSALKKSEPLLNQILAAFPEN